MKRILCYGDSNTWGYVPQTGERYDCRTRWTGILQEEMQDVQIIEEGMSGRTTVWNDPIDGYMSGKEYLYPCLKSHSPIDAVVLALGINDTKTRFSLTPFDIAAGVSSLIEIIRGFQTITQKEPPQILLVRPAPLTENVLTSSFHYAFNEESIRVSRLTLEPFRQTAAQFGCELLDAEECSEAGRDGLHYTAEGHKLFARAAEAKLEEMLRRKKESERNC